VILIVQSLWNPQITEALTEGAVAVLNERGYEYEVLKVPGALEIPLAVKWAWVKAERTQKCIQGAVALGCVVEGDTLHFDLVSRETSRALTDLGLSLRIPVGHGILCVHEMGQAKDRSRPNEENKGREAAAAVVEMLELKKVMEY